MPNWPFLLSIFTIHGFNSCCWWTSQVSKNLIIHDPKSWKPLSASSLSIKLFSSLSVKIGLFYVVYYTLLSGFFIAMLLIFYQTLDEKSPKWQNANGIIGTNPGKTSMFFIKSCYWKANRYRDRSVSIRVGYSSIWSLMQRIHSFSRVIDN